MESKTVLLIEPCFDTRAMYAYYLQHHGYGVRSAASIEQALSAPGALRPGVVVMELNLPGVSGVPAVELVRRTPWTSAATLIVCATDIAPVRQHGLHDAVDCALEKPVRPSAVLHEVRRAAEYAPVAATS